MNAFIEILGTKGELEYLRKAHVTGVAVFDHPPRVELYALNGGTFRQEYTNMETARDAQSEILHELEES